MFKRLATFAVLFFVGLAWATAAQAHCDRTRFGVQAPFITYQNESSGCEGERHGPHQPPVAYEGGNRQGSYVIPDPRGGSYGDPDMDRAAAEAPPGYRPLGIVGPERAARCHGRLVKDFQHQQRLANGDIYVPNACVTN